MYDVSGCAMCLLLSILHVVSSVREDREHYPILGWLIGYIFSRIPRVLLEFLGFTSGS